MTLLDWAAALAWVLIGAVAVGAEVADGIAAARDALERE